MRSAVLASALMATLAMSKPLDKRYYVTVSQLKTVLTTITLPAGQVVTSSIYSHHHGGSTSTVTTVTVTAGTEPSSTSAAAVTSVAETSSAEPTTTVIADPSTTETLASSTVAATSAAASATGANTYQNTVLNQHNLHRSNHSADALAWDDNLASIAQSIAETCVYAHNTTAGGGGYGQNIGAGTTPDQVGSMITDEMYNGEIGFYPLPYGNNNPDMSNFESWGHFSQIVWAKTTKVGCATVNCPNGLANTGGDVSPYFTVCNYSPPGNYAGEYSNVGTPLGDATVTA